MTGRILVVDDISYNVKVLEAKLSNEYYAVFSASNGVEALKLVKQVSPDVILLDVMMPEMDGFECCKKLKENEETSHIPVVMVTALSDISDKINGLKCGADDFITKPISEVHLFARVKSLIRLKTMTDELRMRDKTGTQFGIIQDSLKGLRKKVKGHIALIDDDTVQIKRVRNALLGAGHGISVNDENGAVEFLSNSNFDLIIINAFLDNADGLRIAMQSRANAQNRNVPILMIMEEEEESTLVKALEMGIDDYITSPIDANELVARVQTQMKRKKYQDILKDSYQKSISASVIDQLTKLYNRRYLDIHLINMVKEAKSKKSELSIMTIDIDHFKQVNDRPGWGHHIGDEILVQVAKRIRECVRATDCATRPGGEEFVVIMPNTGLTMAEMIAMRTNKIMSDSQFRISAEPGRVTITVSIGVATFRHDGVDNALELLKRSDGGLYKAKQTGRNKYVVIE